MILLPFAPSSGRKVKPTCRGIDGRRETEPDMERRRLAHLSTYRKIRWSGLDKCLKEVVCKMFKSRWNSLACRLLTRSTLVKRRRPMYASIGRPLRDARWPTKAAVFLIGCENVCTWSSTRLDLELFNHCWQLYVRTTFRVCRTQSVLLIAAKGLFKAFPHFSKTRSRRTSILEKLQVLWNVTNYIYAKAELAFDLQFTIYDITKTFICYSFIVDVLCPLFYLFIYLHTLLCNYTILNITKISL